MQTLKDLAKNVTIKSEQGAARLEWDKRDDWQRKANDWRVTLTYKGRRYSFDFWQGTGIKTAPDAAGVLECLLSDAQSAGDSFEEFCSNMGYNTDSRKAEQIYKACERTHARLSKLFGADYQSFIEAERD
jgi:hypothetical protein